MVDVKLTLEHDNDTESPEEWSEWKLWSFSTRHGNFEHPNDLGIGRVGNDIVPCTVGLRKKLEAGTAFLCSYYQHSGSLWFLKDSPTPVGVEFQFDGARNAGLLVWTGKAKDLGKNKEERAKHAAGYLETYTAWANGECFYYSIENAETGEDVDSCGGFIGSDYFLESVKAEIIADKYNVVEVEGDAAYLWGNYGTR